MTQDKFDLTRTLNPDMLGSIVDRFPASKFADGLAWAILDRGDRECPEHRQTIEEELTLALAMRKAGATGSLTRAKAWAAKVVEEARARLDERNGLHRGGGLAPRLIYVGRSEKILSPAGYYVSAKMLASRAQSSGVRSSARAVGIGSSR